MRGLLSIKRTGAWLFAIAVCTVGFGQAPPPPEISAPLNDLYIQYADAYVNPETVTVDPNDPGGIWRLPRRWRVYVGGEAMSIRKNKPNNQVLARTLTGLPSFGTPVLQTDQFDYGGERDGWRGWIGVEFTPYDKFEVRYHRLNGLPLQTITVFNGLEALQGEFFSVNAAFQAPAGGGNGLQFGIGFAQGDYSEEPMWGVDALWRHRLEDLDSWWGLNWKLTTLAGIRAVRTRENFRFRSIDDLPPPDPDSSFQALFSVRNQLLGPQIGIQAQRRFWDYFEVDLVGKAGYVGNFQAARTRWFREDNAFDSIVFGEEKRITRSAGIFEGIFGLSFYPVENIRLKGNFEFLLLTNVGNAIEQIEINLDRFPRPVSRNNFLYTGFSVGAEILF